MPIPEAISVQFIRNRVKDGVFVPEDVHIKAVAPLLDRLARWAEALRPMRG